MILLDHVTKTYPNVPRPILDEVSLHIEPSEFVFLVGKSGAGKSSLIKMITKEETPTSGNVTIGGIDLKYIKKRHIPHYRRRLGVVFQDFKLLPGRTVYENVAFALEIAGMSNKEIRHTVPKVLELVELSDKAKKFPSALAGGEKQRVAIARAVARQPKILIADEPTANLDVLTKTEIINLLQKINDFGTTVLVATHDENIVNNLRKRVVTIKDGRIVADQKEGGVYRLDRSTSNIPLVGQSQYSRKPLVNQYEPSKATQPTMRTAKVATPQPKITKSAAPTYVIRTKPAPAAAPAKPVRTTTKSRKAPRENSGLVVDSSKLAAKPKVAKPTRRRKVI